MGELNECARSYDPKVGYVDLTNLSSLCEHECGKETKVFLDATGILGRHNEDLSVGPETDKLAIKAFFKFMSRWPDDQIGEFAVRTTDFLRTIPLSMEANRRFLARCLGEEWCLIRVQVQSEGLYSLCVGSLSQPDRVLTIGEFELEDNEHRLEMDCTWSFDSPTEHGNALEDCGQTGHVLCRWETRGPRGEHAEETMWCMGVFLSNLRFMAEMDSRARVIISDGEVWYQDQQDIWLQRVPCTVSAGIHSGTYVPCRRSCLRSEGWSPVSAYTGFSVNLSLYSWHKSLLNGINGTTLRTLVQKDRQLDCDHEPLFYAYMDLREEFMMRPRILSKISAMLLGWDNILYRVEAMGIILCIDYQDIMEIVCNIVGDAAKGVQNELAHRFAKQAIALPPLLAGPTLPYDADECFHQNSAELLEWMEHCAFGASCEPRIFRLIYGAAFEPRMNVMSEPNRITCIPEWTRRMKLAMSDLVVRHNGWGGRYG